MELEEMGPIDYLCVEFPEGTLRGTAFPLLFDLVERKIIRVLDILFVRHETNGEVTVLEDQEVQRSGMGVFHGASSGMLGGDDLREAATVFKPGSAAVILVYENTWAAPLAARLRRNGAQLVAGGRIPVQALLSALDDSEPKAARAVPATGGR